MEKRKKSRKRLSAGSIALIVIAALIVSGLAYGRRVASQRAKSENLKNLVTTQVTRGTITDTVVGTGDLTAGDATEVLVPQGIKVDEIYVDVGDSVKKGTKIASVDKDSVRDQLLDVEEAIDSKNDEIDALTSSDDHVKLKKEIMESDLEDLKDAKTDLEELLEDPVIYANAKGIISEVNMEEGEVVSGTSTDSGSSGADLLNGIDSETLNSMMNSVSKAGEEPVACTKLRDVTAQASTETSAVSAEASSSSAETESASGSSASSSSDSSSSSDDSSSASDGTVSSSDTSSSSSSSSSSAAPTAIEADTFAISITKPEAGAAPQTEAAVSGGSHYKASLAWVPQTKTFSAGNTYTALVMLKAEDGYYFAGDNGKINVKVDSCANALSASYDTDGDGYPDTILVSCPYAVLPEGASDTDSSLLEQQALLQALQMLSKFSENYPDLQKQLQSQIKTVEKSIQNLMKQASSEASSLVSSASSLMDQMSDADLSSLFGNTDYSSLLGSDSTSSASYDTTRVAAAKILPDKLAYVDIDVDELDINKIKKGQTATVTLDALEGQEFEGKITKVSQMTDSETGKYTVRVRLAKTDEMKFGMSATATITIEQHDDVLMVPLDAVQVLDGEDVVYTGVDDDGTLTGPVKIKEGLSDSDNVEITEGLSEGQTICYFQTSEYTNEFESQMETMGD